MYREDGIVRIDKATDGFLLFKSGEGLSKRTLETYEYSLRLFVSWSDNPELHEVTSEMILAHLDYLRNDYIPVRWNGDTQGVSSYTIRNVWIALKSFYSWAQRMLSVDDVMTGGKVPRPRVARTERAPFTVEEVKLLLAEVEPRRAKRPASGARYVQALRDRAIMLTLLDTGIRNTELCALSVGDLHVATGRLKIHGKGNKERLVRLGAVTRPAVWQYLQERGEEDPARPLFATNSNGRLSAAWLRRLLHNLGEAAGVAEVYPHRFRYTFAIQYLRNGGDVFTLQTLLGHSSLKMVMYYLSIANADTERVHQRASPVDNWLR